MSFVALKDLAEINPPAPKLASDEEVSFLPMADASDDGTVTISTLRRYGDVKTGYTGFRNGDVLIAKVTPCFENNKTVHAVLPTANGFGSTEFHVVRAREGVDARYLLHFLRQDRVRAAGQRRMTGSGGQRRVPQGFFDFLKLPKLPFPEQQRIAAILDQADALRRLRRQSINRLTLLANALFEERFAVFKPDTSLELAARDTLIGLVRNAEEFGADFDIPYVRMDAITRNGGFLSEKVLRTSATSDEIERYSLRPGDLMFNTRNSRELVGKTAIFRHGNPTVFNNNIMRLRFTDDWDPVFVEAYLRSRAGRVALEKRKSGTTSVWAVYWSQLKTLQLPKVSMHEQLSYRSIIEAIWQKADALELHSKQSDALFTSLQHRAFAGDL